MKYVTTATVVALAVGVVLGIAYGDKLPVVPALARKLPGASKPTA